MRRFTSYIYVLLAVAVFAVAGCASSGSVAESNYSGTSETQVDNPNLTLADYLQRIPGVEVLGSGGNISVKIRGSSSFMSSTRPLFVLDGMRAGTSYQQVSRLINMHEVSTIRVLKGPDASIYGVDGGNGVILIETRHGS